MRLFLVFGPELNGTSGATRRPNRRLSIDVLDERINPGGTDPCTPTPPCSPPPDQCEPPPPPKPCDNGNHYGQNKDHCRVKGNNGVGNGLDPQPPGNPPVNDGPGTSPGSPGNRGSN
jgi:hypothetical protein